MSERARRLDAKILATFRQACREGQLDVAEHLMRALETLADSPEDDDLPAFACARLDEAYLVVAEGLPPRASRVRCAPDDRGRARKH